MARRRLPLAPLLLAALALAPAAAAWGQAGGDAGRASAIPQPPAPLDVLAAGLHLAPDGMRLLVDGGAGLVEGGDGVLALAQQGGDCRFVTAPLGGAPRTVGAAFPCPNGGRLAGTAGGLVLACTDGAATGDLLRAFDAATFAPTWTARPNLTALPVALPPLDAVPTAPTADLWGCRGVALTATHAIVPYAGAQGRNRVESLALADGKPEWSAAIPFTAFEDLPNGTALPDALGQEAGGFVPTSATVTATGTVVAGTLAAGAAGVGSPPALAWLDGAGRLVGAFALQTDATGQTLPTASAHPAARAALAATVLGSDLVVVNPQAGRPSATPIGTPSLGETLLAAPAWSRQALAVPTEGAVRLVDPQSPSEQRTWPGHAQGRVHQVLLGDATLLVAVGTAAGAPPAADLLVVDALRAASVQRLPLPLAPPQGLSLHLLPVGDRILAWDDSGEAALVGAGSTQPPPLLTADDDYPAEGTPATLTAAMPDGAPANTTLDVAWGDGFLEPADPGRLSHTYATSGARTVTLTARYPDGTTSSVQHRLLVGAAPDPPQGILEVLFAPANQNYTFFGIGLGITLFGSAIAAYGVHKGRHRLERHMRTLERIRDDGRRDPFGAVRALHDFREARRSDLRSGNLEDAQFTVLEARAAEVLELLRSRILGAFTGRVSDRFSHALDVALGDGTIDAQEGDALLASVSSESALTPAEKERLRGLVAAWQRVI